jgi:hypothetical protein
MRLIISALLQKYHIYFLSPLLLVLLPACGPQKAPYVAHRPAYLIREKKSKKEVSTPGVINKNPSSMSQDDLKIGIDYALSIDHKELAIEYIERFLKKSNDQTDLKNMRLQLADLYFETGKLQEAYKLYSLYLSLYPGSDHRAYVHYQAILCRFYMSLTSDRDQSYTEDAFKLTQDYAEYLKQDGQNIYALYSKDVEAIQMQCIEKLFESEKNIYDYYMSRGSYKSAQVRLAHMKQRYIPLLRSCEYTLLNLECDLAKKLHDNELLVAAHQELAHKYPQEHARLIVAQTTPPKKHAIDLF